MPPTSERRSAGDSPGSWSFKAGPGNQPRTFPDTLSRTRGILAKVDLPADGEYINIADAAGHIWGQWHGRNPLVLTVDNKIVYQAVVGGEDVQASACRAKTWSPGYRGIKFQTTGGRIGVASAQEFCRVRRSASRSAGPAADRSFYVGSFQLLYFDAKASAPPSRSRIFICNPGKRQKWYKHCAKKFSLRWRSAPIAVHDE